MHPKKRSARKPILPGFALPIVLFGKARQLQRIVAFFEFGAAAPQVRNRQAVAAISIHIERGSILGHDFI